MQGLAHLPSCHGVLVCGERDRMFIRFSLRAHLLCLWLVRYIILERLRSLTFLSSVHQSSSETSQRLDVDVYHSRPASAHRVGRTSHTVALIALVRRVKHM